MYASTCVICCVMCACVVLNGRQPRGDAQVYICYICDTCIVVGGYVHLVLKFHLTIGVAWA